VKALTRPAKNMTSAPTNINMPRMLFGSSGARRGVAREAPGLIDCVVMDNDSGV